MSEQKKSHPVNTFLVSYVRWYCRAMHPVVKVHSCPLLCTCKLCHLQSRHHEGCQNLQGLVWTQPTGPAVFYGPLGSVYCCLSLRSQDFPQTALPCPSPSLFQYLHCSYCDIEKALMYQICALSKTQDCRLLSLSSLGVDVSAFSGCPISGALAFNFPSLHHRKSGLFLSAPWVHSSPNRLNPTVRPSSLGVKTTGLAPWIQPCCNLSQSFFIIPSFKIASHLF